MAVVPVAGAKMASGNQAAGAHAKFEVEWVADEPVL